MKITPDIIRYEFIGTKANVAASLHEDYVGMGGRVMAETRNTLTILNRGQPKQIIKESAVFNFSFEDGTVVEIDGKLLVGRPEDRLRKNIKRLW